MTAECGEALRMLTASVIFDRGEGGGNGAGMGSGTGSWNARLSSMPVASRCSLTMHRSMLLNEVVFLLQCTQIATVFCPLRMGYGRFLMFRVKDD
jgi:preprotein translocase subunit SecG